MAPTTTTPTTKTRTNYCAGILNQVTRKLSDKRSPLCATPELAKQLKIIPGQSFEQAVLIQVDQRLGGDGCWHSTGDTVLEVL